MKCSQAEWGKGSPGSVSSVRRGLAAGNRHSKEIAKHRLGLGFKGLVMDIKPKLGAGRGLSRPTRNPEDGRHGTLCCLSRRAGRALPRVGRNSGLGARSRTGIFGSQAGRVLALLAHPAEQSPEKNPSQETWGLQRPQRTSRVRLPSCNPFSSPLPSTLQGAAGEAKLARLDRLPGWGDVCGGPTKGVHGQSQAPAAQEGKQQEAEGS